MPKGASQLLPKIVSSELYAKPVASEGLKKNRKNRLYKKCRALKTSANIFTRFGFGETRGDSITNIATIGAKINVIKDKIFINLHLHNPVIYQCQNDKQYNNRYCRIKKIKFSGFLLLFGKTSRYES